jgi:hypothetical protein
MPRPEIERLSASLAEGNAKLKEAEEYGERQRTFKLEWHDKWNTEAKQHDETRSALARLEPYAVALKDAAQGVADLCGPPLDKDEREFVMHLDRLHSLLKVDCGHEIGQDHDVHTDHPLRHYDRTCPACNSGLHSTGVEAPARTSEGITETGVPTGNAGMVSAPTTAPRETAGAALRSQPPAEWSPQVGKGQPDAFTPNDAARWRTIQHRVKEIVYNGESPTTVESDLCWLASRFDPLHAIDSQPVPPVTVIPTFPLPVCIHCKQPIKGEAHGQGQTGGTFQWWHPLGQCVPCRGSQ